MSSSPASPIDQRDTRAQLVSMTLQSMALNVLFPPPPRLPDDMLAALTRMDQRKR